MFYYAKTNFKPFFWLILAALVSIIFNPKSKLAWSGLLVETAMLFFFIKSRPFWGYLELIGSLLPIAFAILYELKITFLPKLKEIWSIRGISLKRIFCKALILSLISLCIYSVHLMLNESLLSRAFKIYNSAEFAEFARYKQNEFYEMKSLIPEDERNSVVSWGDSIPVSQFLLESDIKPRCRFFGNIQVFFGRLEPAVIDEWIENVRNDYPKWIVYNALIEEYSDEDMGYFKYEFGRERNPRVEEILDEKYVLVKDIEMEFNPYVIMLYRLK